MAYPVQLASAASTAPHRRASILCQLR